MTPSTNTFDQACRYAAKLDPPGLLHWLLDVPPPTFAFAGWLDTRTIPFPSEPDRVCDTVARIEDLARGSMPWAMPIEFQLVPDGLMFGRMLEYLGRLWQECKADSERGSRYRVAPVVVNLTGRGDCSLEMSWPEVKVGLHLLTLEHNLQEHQAGPTLDKIERGELRRCVLPWVPLIQGGAEQATLDKWIELANAEPETRMKANYAGLAKVFAEVVDQRELWTESLKEFNVRESQQVLEWQAEARVEMLLKILQSKFKTLPTELVERIQKTTDSALLDQWAEHVVAANSLDEFRQLANV